MQQTLDLPQTDPDQLAPAPRPIGWVLSCLVLFGTPGTQSMWLLAAVGSIVFWGFTMNANLLSWRQFDGELVRVRGTITENSDSHFKENRVRIYTSHYSFTDEYGRVQTGTSYGSRSYREGERATIEYPAGEPETSRIKGLRPKPFSPIAGVTVIFTLAGLFQVTRRTVANARLLSLLRHGNLVVRSKPAKRGTEETLTVVDPHEPSRRVALNSVIGAPRVAGAGGLEAGTDAGVIGVMLLPALIIIGNAVYYFWFFR
jgi:hypothetical protein